MGRSFACAQLLLHHIGEHDELADGELLGAPREHGLREKRAALSVATDEQRAQRHTQHLATLVEHSLHHTAEQQLVAIETTRLIARKTHHRALHLGRRVEHTGLDGEQIVDTVPRLHKHRQNAVGLTAGRRGQTLRHLALDHARAAGDEVAVVEQLEENLRRDVVRVVAREHKRLSAEHRAEVHAQEVVGDDMLAQTGETLVEVGHRLGVDLDDLQRAPLTVEKLGEHAHARPYLEHGQTGTGVDGVGDAAGYGQVGEEMLTEVLLRSYWLHIGLQR